MLPPGREPQRTLITLSPLQGHHREHCTMFGPLKGHPRGHLIPLFSITGEPSRTLISFCSIGKNFKGHLITFNQWKGTLEGTLSYFHHWKGTNGTLHWESVHGNVIKEGRSSCLMQHKGHINTVSAFVNTVLYQLKPSNSQH